MPVRVFEFRSPANGNGVVWHLAGESHGGTIDRRTLGSLRKLWAKRERGPDVAARMVETLKSKSTFLDVWLQLASGGLASPVDRRFVFHDLPPAASVIPWEFLIEALMFPQDRDTVTLVRGCSAAEGGVRVIDAPLRILHLVGAVSAPGTDVMDLCKERELVRKAWKSLSRADREYVAEPIFEDADARIPDRIRQVQPHVVWFSGHGRHRGTTELLLADGEWATAGQFAELVGTSSEPPVAAVFWACSSGQVASDYASEPDLFRAMTTRGTDTLLMLQAAVGDANATHLAESLMSHMALGMPLDCAVARARSELRERLLATPDDPRRALDWVLPTLWTSTRSTVEFQWDDARIDLIRRRHLSRAIIKDGLGVGQLDGDPTADDNDRADAWTARSRTWVHEVADADRYGLLRTLLAIVARGPHPVIWIDLAGYGWEEGLRRWAERVRSLVGMSEAPRALVSDLRDLATANPEPAWRSLCGTRQIVIAVTDPPDLAVETERLWQPLLESVAEHVIITSRRPMPPTLPGAWGAVQRADDGPSEWQPPTDPATRRLMNALVVIERPLPPAYLQIHGVIEGLAAQQAVAQLGAALASSLIGDLYMYDGVKRRLHERLSPGELAQAHADAVVMLAQVGGHDPDLDAHVLEHLVQAGDLAAEQAADMAAHLCLAYRSEGKPAQLRGIVDLVGDRLPVWARPAAGWAYMLANNVSAASYWLNASQPHGPGEEADWHALKAELSKRMGTRESYAEAFGEIKKAVQLWDRVLVDEPDDQHAWINRAGCRQDEARLHQYIHHDYRSAAAVYAELVADEQLPDLMMAAIKRNYAECLRRLSRGPGTDDWARAQQNLSDAARLARRYPASSVWVEALYEQSRMAGEEGRADAEVALLKACIRDANTGGHGMLGAIARNALFWTEAAPFNLPAWRQVESDLLRYEAESWAARALLNSRIRAAQRAWAQHLVQEADEMLEANKQLLIRRHLDAGDSDKKRIAYTYAGLCEITGQPAPWAEMMRRFPSMRDWVDAKPDRGPSALWSLSF